MTVTTGGRGPAGRPRRPRPRRSSGRTTRAARGPRPPGRRPGPRSPSPSRAARGCRRTPTGWRSPSRRGGTAPAPSPPGSRRSCRRNRPTTSRAAAGWPHRDHAAMPRRRSTVPAYRRIPGAAACATCASCAALHRRARTHRLCPHDRAGRHCDHGSHRWLLRRSRCHRHHHRPRPQRPAGPDDTVCCRRHPGGPCRRDAHRGVPDGHRPGRPRGGLRREHRDAVHRRRARLPAGGPRAGRPGRRRTGCYRRGAAAVRRERHRWAAASGRRGVRRCHRGAAGIRRRGIRCCRGGRLAHCRCRSRCRCGFGRRHSHGGFRRCGRACHRLGRSLVRRGYRGGRCRRFRGAVARRGRGLGPPAVGGRRIRERRAQLAHDGCFDGRRCRFDEFAEFVQLGDHVLAGLTQLLRDRADADLACHCSPSREAWRVRRASTIGVRCSSVKLHSVLTMGRPRSCNCANPVLARTGTYLLPNTTAVLRRLPGRDEAADRCHVQTLHARKCPVESPTLLCQCRAPVVRVYPGSSARQPATRIGHQFPVRDDNSQ